MLNTLFKRSPLIRALCLSSGCFIAASTHGQETKPYFASIGYASLEYTDKTTNNDANLDSVVFRLGQNFSRYFSGDIRIGLGTNKETLNNQLLELDRYYGAYAKVGYPIANVAFPYLTLGYTNTRLNFLQGDAETQDENSGFSFGIGTDFKISERLEINLEYMSYVNKNNLDIQGAQISISAPFSD